MVKSHLYEYSGLVKHVDNPNTYSTIVEVADMIDSGFAKPFYALTSANITTEEKIHMDIYNISEVIAAMYKDNCRFILTSSEESIGHFSKILFSTKANNKDGVNNHCTYFIDKDISKSEVGLKFLFISIILNKIHRYLETEYNFDIYRDNQTEYVKFEDNLSISDIKLLITIYDLLFSILDKSIGLKYEDEASIIEATLLLTGSIDKFKRSTLSHIYKNAITLPRDPADDNSLFKKIYSYIINNK